MEKVFYKSRLALLIPFYNDFEGLIKSLNSIKDKLVVDIVIVDDGSKEVLKLSHLEGITFEGNVNVITMTENVGIENALNAGLGYINDNDYEYVGRLDSGDTCLEDRFFKQVTYLDQNPDLLLLGSWANYIDEKSNKFLYTLQHPCSHDQIVKKMCYNSCFIHPSVVFRLEVVKDVGYYPVDCKYAEDYGYFYNIMNFGRVENYPEPLINYYVNENSISTLRRKEQIKSRIKVIKKNVPFSFVKALSLGRNYLLLYTSRNLILKIKKYAAD